MYTKDNDEKNRQIKKRSHYKQRLKEVGFGDVNNEFCEKLEKFQEEMTDKEEGAKRIPIFKKLFDRPEIEDIESLRAFFLEKDAEMNMDDFYLQSEINEIFFILSYILLDPKMVLGKIVEECLYSQEMFNEVFGGKEKIESVGKRSGARLKYYANELESDRETLSEVLIEEIKNIFEKNENELSEAENKLRKFYLKTNKKLINEILEDMYNLEILDYENSLDGRHSDIKIECLLHHSYNFLQYILENYYISKRFFKTEKYEYLNKIKRELLDYENSLYDLESEIATDTNKAFLDYIGIKTKLEEFNKKIELKKLVIAQKIEIKNILEKIFSSNESYKYIITEELELKVEKLKKYFKKLNFKDNSFDKRIKNIIKLFKKLESDIGGQIFDKTEENIIIAYSILYFSDLKFKNRKLKTYVKDIIENGNFFEERFCSRNTKKSYEKTIEIRYIQELLKYCQALHLKKEEEVEMLLEIEEIQIRILEKIIKTGQSELILSNLVYFFKFEIKVIANLEY